MSIGNPIASPSFLRQCPECKRLVGASRIAYGKNTTVEIVIEIARHYDDTGAEICRGSTRRLQNSK